MVFLKKLALPARIFRWHLSILLFVSSALSSCKVLPQSDSVDALPDLTVRSVSLQMSTQGSKPCVDEYGPYQVWAMVENVGNAPAGPVDVSASTGEVIQIQLLEAGESQTVRFQASPDTGSYLVQVDPQNTIAESDENNNMSSFLAPTPTPPALCSTPQPASP